MLMPVVIDLACVQTAPPLKKNNRSTQAMIESALCSFGSTTAVDLLLKTHFRLVFVLICPRMLPSLSLVIGYLIFNHS